MTPAAIVTFVLIAGFVWGGFALILRRAVRSEAAKLDAPGSERE